MPAKVTDISVITVYGTNTIFFLIILVRFIIL